MRSLIVTLASFMLTGFVVGNAYYQKKQFYPSVVYITKSNPSMAVLYIQAFVFVILMGKLMRKVFFGQLRAAEMEHLIERSWYAVTETCLAFTVFRDDFSPRFVAMFTLLLFLKCFHWLAEDRVDYMERSPVISFLFHCRVLSLLSFLSVLDIYFINSAYYSTLLKGASVQLVFGFEYAILLTMILMTFMKYVLHTLDVQNENPWENKAVYLLYTELVMGFIRVVLYLVFMAIMIKVHTFPLFAIRPMYLSLRSFKKALHDVIMSRRAIRNMNTLYPDATPEELAAGDNVCIICREEMAVNCKKLPCNHIFHTNCLRSWFQRQQTCPTCRMDVLRMPRPPPPPPVRPVQQQPDVNMQNFQAMFQGMPFGWPPAQHPAQQPPVVPAATGGATTTTATPTTGTTSTAMPANFMPPFSPPMQPHGSFFPMMPYCMPMGFPPPPSNMTGLSMEELRAMEGQERENVAARIQWLKDIQALLDGAMVLISQYNQVASQMSMPGIATTRPNSSTVTTTASSSSSTPTSSTSTSFPSSSGARPKTTVKSEDTSLKSSSKSSVKEEKSIDYSAGAIGYTPPREELIPEWQDPAEEEHEDAMHEVRKRRLKHFSTDDPNEKDRNANNNLDLD